MLQQTCSEIIGAVGKEGQGREGGTSRSPELGTNRISFDSDPNRFGFSSLAILYPKPSVHLYVYEKSAQTFPFGSWYRLCGVFSSKIPVLFYSFVFLSLLRRQRCESDQLLLLEG